MNWILTTKKKYERFLRKTSKLIFNKTSPSGYVIFCQTDRMLKGELIDKSSIISAVAKKCKFNILWHKGVQQNQSLFRPGWSHILCYSKMTKPGKKFKDFFEQGEKSYSNGTPENVAESLMIFLKESKQSYVMDPFVGRGTLGKFAIKQGLYFVGIDIDKNQCKIAQQCLEECI